MIEAEAVYVLRDMVEELEGIKESLDTTETVCSCCGLLKATNYDEMQLARQLDGTINRLHKHIGHIREHGR